MKIIYKIKNLFIFERIILPFLVLLSLISLFNCGASQNNIYTQRISGLEQRVSRLESISRTKMKQTDELEEKLLTLETAMKRYEKSSQINRLPVIKIMPQNESNNSNFQYEQQNNNSENSENFYVQNDSDLNQQPVNLTLIEDTPHRIINSSSIGNKTQNSFESFPELPQVDEKLPIVPMEANLEQNETEINSDNSMDPAEKLFVDAQVSFQNSNYEESYKMFSDFINRYPNHEKTGEAFYYKARSVFSQGDLLRSIGDFERFLRRFPQHRRVPDVIWYIGEAYRLLNDDAQAQRFYHLVVTQFPTSLAARRATVYLQRR